MPFKSVRRAIEPFERRPAEQNFLLERRGRAEIEGTRRRDISVGISLKNRSLHFADDDGANARARAGARTARSLARAHRRRRRRMRTGGECKARRRHRRRRRRCERVNGALSG